MAIPPLVLRIYADASGVKQGVVQAQGQVNGLRASVARNAGLIKTALGAGFVAGAVIAVKAASDLGEAQNKVNVIFGESSKAVTEFSQDSAKIGLATAEALSAAGAFGSMFDAAGLASAESAKMSTTMVQLAGDMASFNNASPEEMLEKLRSGLAGEAEPLRRFGVFISEAAVQTEAFASGIAKQGDELTDVQKIQARYNIIMRDTAKQQGDFARTANSLPNLLRTLRAEAINLAAAIGTKLLPFVVGLVKAVRPLVGVLIDLAPLLIAAAAGFAAWWTVGKIVGLAGAIYNVTGSMTALTVASSAAAGPIGIIVGLIAGFVALEASSTSAIDRQAASLEDLGYSARVSGAIIEGEFNRSLKEIPGDLRSANMAVYDHIAALENGGNAAKAAGGQSAYYASQLEGEADASGKATKSARELRQARLALAGGLLGLVAQLNTLKDAHAEVNRLEEAGKKGTEAYKDAKLVLLQEIVASKDALINYGQSLDGVPYSEVRDKLVEMGRQYGLTRDDVLDVLKVVKETNAAWANTPRNVRTNYAINTTFTGSGVDPRQRQHGGPVSMGQPYIVGEAGPELFVPNGSGQIVPNHDLATVAGGDTTIVVKLGDEVLARVVEKGLNRAAARH